MRLAFEDVPNSELNYEYWNYQFLRENFGNSFPAHVAICIKALSDACQVSDDQVLHRMFSTLIDDMVAVQTLKPLEDCEHLVEEQCRRLLSNALHAAMKDVDDEFKDVAHWLVHMATLFEADDEDQNMVTPR